MDVLAGYQTLPGEQGKIPVSWLHGAAWTRAQNLSLNSRAVQKSMCSVPGRVNFAAYVVYVLLGISEQFELVDFTIEAVGWIHASESHLFSVCFWAPFQTHTGKKFIGKHYKK